MLRLPRPVALLVSAPLVALASCAAPTAGVDDALLDDPDGFCAAVGTADQPEEEGYAGPKVPAWMAHVVEAQTGLGPDDFEDGVPSVEWRCAGGAVLLCSYGANIPCGSKADTETTPGEGARTWCGEHPDAEAVPAVATGHETVFGWRCAGTEAVIDQQWATVDAQGYQADFWHRVDPGMGDAP